MRVRQPFLISAAVTVTSVAAVSVPLAAQATSGPRPAVNVARQAAEKAVQAFEARMAARTGSGAAPATAAPSAANAGPGAVTGSAFATISNVGQISRDTVPASSSEIEPDTQTEPDIAIDPGNPKIITADFQQGRNGPFGGSQAPGYATSQDGGRTWTGGNLPKLTTADGGTFQLASDTAAAFGPDGSDYAQTIPFDETDARSGVAVQRSTDGGRTFGPPSLVVDDNNVNIFNDKNWIAVDTFRGSPHYGRIYSVWSRFITTGSGSSAVTHSPGAVSYSDDHGRTWSPIHFTTGQDADTEGLLPLIHPDGSITVVYDLTVGNADYETAQTSRDGGNTWSHGVTVGQFLGAGVPGMRTGGLPAAAIDASTGHMYAVWQDTRFNTSKLNDIVLSASTDGGKSWSSPRPVSPAGAGLDRFTPAVAAAGGAVHVTYRTRGANGTAPSVSEDYIASTDGGRTFGPQHQVGPATVLKWAAVSNEAPPPVAFLGDYMAVAVAPTDPNRAELVWSVSSRPPSNETYHQTTWAATVSR